MVCCSDTWSGPMWEGGSQQACSGSEVLRSFGACGGLALVAARLPRPHAAPAPPPAPPHHTDMDWVKLEDFYEVSFYVTFGQTNCRDHRHSRPIMRLFSCM